MSRHPDPPPAPFAAGKVPQTIVHYTGQKRGGMSYRGRASGRRYPFDADDCCHYVPDEDLEFFRLHSEFDVLDGDETHIDPAKERAIAERERLKEELRREVMNVLSLRLPAPRGTGNGSRGRKPGGGFGAFLDCLMECADLPGLYGSVESAYDAVAKRVKHMPEWSGRVPPRENFPKLCSYGRAKRLNDGRCTWQGHPQPWPA